MPEADIEAAAGPTDKELSKVTRLAREQLDHQKEIETLEKRLSEAQLRLKINREQDLPAAMDEAKIAEFKLSNGASVTIKTSAQASITEANRPKAHAWLEKHKHGALIKRQIQILFGKGEDTWAKKFLADCKKRKLKLKLATKEWVDHNTLKAFVREQRSLALEEKRNPDEAVPKDLFGVYVARFAEVTLPEDPQ